MSCFTRHTAAASSFAEPDPTKHVNYAFGMVLGVDDFTQEFAYLSGRDQWMARDLIGYGTARGLRVTVEVDAQGPRVVVAPGVAVSPRGQLICVESAQCAYINQWLAGHTKDLLSRLGSPPASSVKLYVVLCYRDCPTDNLPIPGEPCRSDAQLTAPSRLADDFELELSFRKPEQREEDAINDFVGWLKQVTVSEAASTPFEQFLQAIRDAAGAWLAPDSPPSSPPSDFLFGSPPAFLNINTADLCRYTEAAFRLWVTELRPRWIGRWHGCSPAPFGLANEHDDECVLLAELDVPLLQNLPSAEWVAGSGVVLNEESRPYLVHLRMLQEWLLCAQGRGQLQAGGGPPPPPPPPPAPVVLAGDVSGPPENNLLRRIGPVDVDVQSVPNAGQVLTAVTVSGQRRWRAANPVVTSVVTTNGDVTGPSNNNVVGRIQTVPVVNTPPTVNQVLTAFDDAGTIRWRPANLPPAPPAGTLAGDVTGAAGANTVERIRGTLVETNAPTLNQVLMAVQVGGGIRWRASNLPAPPAPNVALDGDVRGPAGSNLIAALQNTTVEAEKVDPHQMLTAVADPADGQISWRPTHNFVRYAASDDNPSFGIVAAGVVRPGMELDRPSYGNLQVKAQQPGVIVSFDGYVEPTRREDNEDFLTHQYVVKVLPIFNEEIPSFAVSFFRYVADGLILAVTAFGQVAGSELVQNQFGMMIEISRFPVAD